MRFAEICFFLFPAGTPEGHLVASNNGVERDGETQRLTVHCSNKFCKKRQCKAIKLSFKNSSSMNEAVIMRIIALMQVSPVRCGEVLVRER